MWIPNSAASTKISCIGLDWHGAWTSWLSSNWAGRRPFSPLAAWASELPSAQPLSDWASVRQGRKTEQPGQLFFVPHPSLREMGDVVNAFCLNDVCHSHLKPTRMEKECAWLALKDVGWHCHWPAERPYTGLLISPRLSFPPLIGGWYLPCVHHSRVLKDPNKNDIINTKDLCEL